MKLFSKTQIYIKFDNDKSKLFKEKEGKIITEKTFDINSEEQLSRVLEEESVSAKKAIILIPSYKLYIRALNLPEAAKDKLDEIIKVQVLEKLPHNIDELNFIYWTFETGKRINVIVFIIERKLLDKYFYTCQQVNLKIKSIIPDNIGYILRFEEEKNKELVLNIDVNQSSLHFMFETKDDQYIRTCKNDNNFKEELDKTYEFIKKKYSLSESPPIILNKKKADYDKIYLDKIEEKDYLKSIIELRDKEKEENFLSCLKKHNENQKKKSYRFIWIAIILILLINGTNLFLNWQIKRDRLNEIKASLARLDPAIKESRVIEKEYSTTNEKLKLFKQEVNPTFSYLPWLNELSQILSEDQKIDKITFSGNSLDLIAGEAKSATNVLKKLDESSMFKNIHFTGSISSVGDKEKFKIAGDLVYDIQ